MKNYELWLTDDYGKRMGLLDDVSYISYSRATRQYGSLEFGLPFAPFAGRFNPWFKPDWRVEVWRSPTKGIPMRREDVFLLRKAEVYTRASDNVQMIRFYGRNGKDLLSRRMVIQLATTQWTTKTDYADDMMKAIVREQMLYGSAVDETGTSDDTRAYPQGEFSVQNDVSQGPSLPQSFEGKKVIDALKAIQDATFQLYADDPNSPRVYFDVSPVNLSGNAPLGWIFNTRTGIYGSDRTNGKVFSLENENIKSPSYAISHLEEVNTVYVNGGGRGESQLVEMVQDTRRVNASRWNRMEDINSASNETDTSAMQTVGKASLNEGRPAEDIPLVFLNTPGSPTTPQSLYGVDWDLGDRLRVNYADRQFDADVNIVYISVHEDGREEITGRNEVNRAG